MREPSGPRLTGRQRELVAARYDRAMETETGYRSGSPLHPQPGEPRPAYDPVATTLHGRRLAKVAEMPRPLRLAVMRVGPGDAQDENRFHLDTGIRSYGDQHVR